MPGATRCAVHPGEPPVHSPGGNGAAPTRFPMLRQQGAHDDSRPNRSLADFVAPKASHPTVDPARLLALALRLERQVAEEFFALPEEERLAIENVHSPQFRGYTRLGNEHTNGLRDLRDQGVAILFVSHFLDQVYAISDRFTILRNGRLVGEYEAANLPRLELVSKMIGKDVAAVQRMTSHRQEACAPATSTPLLSATSRRSRDASGTPRVWPRPRSTAAALPRGRLGRQRQRPRDSPLHRRHDGEPVTNLQRGIDDDGYVAAESQAGLRNNRGRHGSGWTAGDDQVHVDSAGRADQFGGPGQHAAGRRYRTERGARVGARARRADAAGPCHLQGVGGTDRGVIARGDHHHPAGHVTAFVAFVVWELRRRKPMLDPRHFEFRGGEPSVLVAEEAQVRRQSVKIAHGHGTELAAQGWDGIEWRVVDQKPPTGAAGFWSGNKCTWPQSSFR